MRKIITIITIVALATACNSKPASEKKPVGTSKSDTARLLAVFKINGTYKLDSVVKITRDTFKLSQVDTATGAAKMEWQKDIVYYAPILVDSVKKEVRWYGFTPEYFQEVNIKEIK